MSKYTHIQSHTHTHSRTHIESHTLRSSLSALKNALRARCQGPKRTNINVWAIYTHTYIHIHSEAVRSMLKTVKNCLGCGAARFENYTCRRGWCCVNVLLSFFFGWKMPRYCLKKKIQRQEMLKN